ncbi:MAG: hypothetical protein EXR21_08495 [Flavobacteriaceae bacterium]|nr:hypothetical protein [Flavobacteriaceae bacterium]
MKDSKTGKEYWFKVKSRAMSAAQVHSGHKECGTQLHTQKEETLIEADSSSMNLFLKFIKGDLNVASEFGISGHFFDMINPTIMDSMTVSGKTYYQVEKGLNQLADRSTKPPIKELWRLFYTPKKTV